MRGTLSRNEYVALWLASAIVVGMVFLLCMCVGPGEAGGAAIKFGWPRGDIWELRLMRVLPAGLVGLALAASGVALQALLRNPLADPYVLGISSGSSVGVMVWLLAVGPFYGVFANSDTIRVLLKAGAMAPALIGALATCMLVFVLARSNRNGNDSLTLLLVGVVVSAVNGALLLLLNHLAPEDVRLNLQNYMMGTISNDVSWTMIGVAGAVLLIGFVPLVLAGRALNVGSFSDVEAVSMGVKVASLRRLCFISASIMTGASIMLSGPIGFVGLICPHICRSLIGSDHRRLLVTAPMCGAAFLMLADTFVGATGNLFHGELPVGVITALCGGPFFLFLLRRKRGESEAA